MVHIGKNTSSRIVSKGISAGRGQQTYRGLVSICQRQIIQKILHNVTHF